MAKQIGTSGTPGNRLLGSLPQDEVDAILPHLEPILLQPRNVVIDVNTPIEYVYFPEDGVVSIVSVMTDGSVVEVATIGNEGMIGLPVFLKATRTLSQAFCQVPGSAFRLPSAIFRDVASRGKFNDLMHRYAQALFAQVSQSAACNRLHLAEERFARWILMTHDRVGGDDFQLTQDFLSQMLGVRRATVSEVAAQAQRDGLIRYHRGHMTIVNRKGLEARACECYAIIQAEFDQLFGEGSPNALERARIRLPAYSRAGNATAGEAIPHGDREGPNASMEGNGAEA
ncbi:MAG: Crp/Fnr family transcriptional regulator [Myxococcota bacterium]